MKLIIEPSYTVSNQIRIFSDRDDLMMGRIKIRVFLDITADLSTQEFSKRVAKDELDPDDWRVEIGVIKCTQFHIMTLPLEDYGFLARHTSEQLAMVADYLFESEVSEHIFERMPCVIHYLESVSIKPKYRGHDYELYAVALYLQAEAEAQIVACHPRFMAVDRKKGKKALTEYWSRLDLFCDGDPNPDVLLNSDWYMPELIEEKLFKPL